jgi:hypothetical protein
LSLEGLLEWQHHRSLVREARENMSAEIERNKKVIANDLENLGKSETQVQRIISTVRKLESDPAFKVDQLAFSGSFGNLSSTAWNTANRSGAIAYIDYHEVEKYTEVYDQQQNVLNVEFQGIAHRHSACRTNSSSPQQGPEALGRNRPKELEGLADHALILVTTLEGAAKELSSDYEKIK